MTHYKLRRNLLAWTAGPALTALAAASAMAGAANPASSLTAAQATALCAPTGLKAPVSLGTAIAPPPAGARGDQLKTWCVRQGFSESGTETVTTLAALSVTGTYLKPKVGDDPINIEHTGRDDLLQQGNPGIAQIIRGLSETGLNNNGDNSGQNSTGFGVRTINLRNLGSGRTLILFDGVRLADDPQTNGGPAVTFDPNVNGGGAQNVNTIPMEILSSVDVLKDAGSAAYGAGASAGAINFTPRRDLNGFEMNVSAFPIPVAVVAALLGLNALHEHFDSTASAADISERVRTARATGSNLVSIDLVQAASAPAQPRTGL